MRKIFTFLFFSCIISAYAVQDIYVSTMGNDENDGSNESPFATLVKAVSMVTEDGATIHVAAGTYVFTEPAEIQPYDQTIVGEDAATTILDGGGSSLLINGMVNMQSSDKALTIRNLAFKNGKMNVTDAPGGAAIRMGVQTNLLVEDCYFYNNKAESTDNAITWGGAIFFLGNNLTVDRCFFEENASLSNNAEGYGGAIAVRHLFNENLKTPASGTHIPVGDTYAVIKNSTFYKNSTKSKGGAVYFNKQLDANLDDEDATFVVQNCVFLENIGVKDMLLGAAVALSSGSNSENNKAQTIILTNNTMYNNYQTDVPGTPKKKSTVLLEGFRYTSYMANNIIISETAPNDFALHANQPAPIEYGMNNIIDKVNANINGADFVADKVTKKNMLDAVTAEDINLNTTLVGYPISETAFSVPYLTLANGSSAINGGVNSYFINTIANPAPADPVEFVLSADIQGTYIHAAVRDLGAFEWTPSTSAHIEKLGNKTVINESNGIRILNTEKAERITIYSINGMMISEKLADSHQTYVPLKVSGLYIININGQAYKHYFK